MFVSSFARIMFSAKLRALAKMPSSLVLLSPYLAFIIYCGVLYPQKAVKF